MVDEDHLCPVAQLHIVSGKSFISDLGKLCIKSHRIDDQTVADHAGHFRAENAGGNKVKHITFITDFHRVTGVVAALKTHDHIYITGKDIDQFTFTLITPLGTDQNIYRHS